MSQSFSYKLTTENEQFTFDFSNVLGSTETISGTPAVAITVKEGTDPSPSSMLLGVALVSGSRVAQRIYGGLDQVTYTIAVTITTSLTNVYTYVADLPVLAVASL